MVMVVERTMESEGVNKAVLIKNVEQVNQEVQAGQEINSGQNQNQELKRMGHDCRVTSNHNRNITYDQKGLE